MNIPVSMHYLSCEPTATGTFSRRCSQALGVALGRLREAVAVLFGDEAAGSGLAGHAARLVYHRLAGDAEAARAVLAFVAGAAGTAASSTAASAADAGAVPTTAGVAHCRAAVALPAAKIS